MLNLIQSAFTDLTGDEALYWMYGQLPDWGYKDHTPVIGMMIHLGSKLLPGSIGARLLVVAALAITLYLVWLLAAPVRTGPFVLLAASMPVLHIYGFIATPDVPLLLATSAYLVVWKSFLAEPGWRRALWLGFWMGALVWSKYHGLLVILFTWLPHRRLWLNGWFWMA
ncbi:MAG: glycosyltransferase family 39 protein, partial [Bacteroidota bacterium]